MSEEIASIGIKVDTADIERGGVALEALAGKGAKAEKAIGSLEGVAAKAGKTLENLGKGGGGAWAADSGARKAAASMEGLAAAAGSADQATKRVASSGSGLSTLADMAQKVRDQMTSFATSTMEAAKSMSFSAGARSLDGVSTSAQAATMATSGLSLAASKLVGVLAGLKLADMVKDATMLAARYETMGVVMGVAGNNAGYTRKEMEGFSQALQKSGISMMQSRNSLTQLATAHIDLAKAAQLGRAAQDLALVAGINSSDALGRMIQGIKSGEVEILRTLGLNVNFEQSYKDLARTLGTTSDSLTEQQKVLARTNAALSGAARYAGIYEESMTTAGKAITSLTRYWENLRVMAMATFLPALAEGVNALTDGLKAANKELEASGQSLDGFGAALGGGVKTAIQTVAVLGANVAYVFKAMGTEIGGIVAQAAALKNLDFKGAATIHAEMVADAETSRKALDAFEDKVLNGTDAMKKQGEAAKQTADGVAKQAEAAKGATAMTEQQRIEAGKLAQATETAANAANQLHDAAQKSLTIEQQRAGAVAKLRKEYELATAAGTSMTEQQKQQAKQDYERSLRAVNAAHQPSVNRDQLLDAIALQESGGRQFDRSGRVVTSSVGALGMYQIMPSSGPDLARRAGVEWSRARLEQDANYGRTLASAYVQDLMRMFDGDVVKALAAYHSGQGNVANAVKAAGPGGDWLSRMGPVGRQYPSGVLGRMTQDYKGNFDGLKPGQAVNREAVEQQKQLREQQDATAAATAALKAEQDGYNKSMAEFIGLQATQKWQAMNAAQQEGAKAAAVAASNNAALAESQKSLEAAANGAKGAWAEYNATISKTAGYTSEMATEQVRYERAMEGAAKNALTQATIAELQAEHTKTMAALQEKSAVQQASALEKQADQLRVANQNYGKSAIAIGEDSAKRLENAIAIAKQQGGSEGLLKSLEAQLQAQRKVNTELSNADFKKLNEGLDEWTRSATEQAKLYADEAQLASLSAVERAKIVALRQVELRLAKELDKIEKTGGTSPEDEAEREKARQKARTAAAIEGEAAVAKVVQDEWQKGADQINQSLTDALLRGFESGKDFAKNFRDTLKNMFRTLVLKPIIQWVVSPISGAVQGVLSATGLTTTGATGSSGAGLLGLASNASSAYNLASGAYSAAGIGAGIANAGAWMGSGAVTNFGLGMVASPISEAAIAVGAMGPAATGTAGSMGAAAGALWAAAPYAAIALVVLNALGVFRSTKVNGYGIAGTLGQGDNADVHGFTEYRRGGTLFSGPSYYKKPTDLPDEQRSAIQTATDAVFASVTNYGRALGLNADTIAGYTQQIDLATNNLKPEEIQAKLAEIFAQMANSLSEQIAGGALSQFTRSGETSSATLQRLAANLTGVNQVLDSLNEAMLQTSLVGGDAASKLIDAFGSLDNYKQQAGSFLQNYYSEDERRSIMQRQFEQTFAGLDLGGESPKTREEFRRRVEAQDLMTDKGRSTYAALLSLSDIFATLTETTTDTGEAARAAAEAEAQAAERRRSVQDQIDKLTGNTAAVTERQRAIDMAAAGSDTALQGLLTQLWGLQDAADAAAQATAAQAAEAAAAAKRGSVQDQIDSLLGNSRAVTERQRASEYAAAGADTALQHLLDQLWNLQDAAEATAKASEAAAAAAEAEAAAKQRRSAVQDQIDNLLGNTAAVTQRNRSAEFAAAAGDAELQRLLDQLWGLQDAADAAATATQAATRAEELRRQGVELNARVLELTGRSAEATALRRAEELAALDPTLQATQRYIYALQDEASAKAQYISALDSSYSALERAVDAEKTALTARQQTAQELVSTLSGIFDTLKRNVADLYGSVTSTTTLSAAAGRDFIANALRNARATGYMPDGTDLADAISAARGGMDSKGYASRADYDRDRLVLAAQLAEMGKYSEAQLTDAQKQVRLAEDQIKRLDETLKTEKQQIDVLRGVDTSVQSVTSALAALHALTGAGFAATVGAVTSAGALTAAASAAAAAAAQAAALQAAAASRAANAWADTSGAVIGAGAASSSSTSSLGWMQDGTYKYHDGILVRTVTGQDALDAAKKYGVRGFDVGTNYVPQDMLAVVHKGEAIVPRAYNPAAGGGSDAGVIAVLQASLSEQRAANAALRAEVAALAQAMQGVRSNTDELVNAGVQVRTSAREPLAVVSA